MQPDRHGVPTEGEVRGVSGLPQEGREALLVLPDLQGHHHEQPRLFLPQDRQTPLCPPIPRIGHPAGDQARQPNQPTTTTQRTFAFLPAPGRPGLLVEQLLGRHPPQSMCSALPTQET